MMSKLGSGLVVGDKSPLVLDASTDISLFLHSLAAICLRLSSDVSQSDVSEACVAFAFVSGLYNCKTGRVSHRHFTVK